MSHDFKHAQSADAARVQKAEQESAYPKPVMGQSFDIDAVPPDLLLKYVNQAGGQRAFARKYKVKRSTLQTRLYKLRDEAFKHQPPPEPRAVGRKGVAQVFFLCAAQDNTQLHQGFLTNIEAYAAWINGQGVPAEILVSGFTYGKSLFEDHAKTSGMYHERVLPYLVDERIRIGDHIDFCAEMNTLPTKVHPLSGFETYTRERWGVFPHAKVQLKSVPTMQGTRAKQNMTTGALTMPNYIQKDSGIKASFHHVVGCLIVEVLEDGKFFCRHIIAEDDGSFYDLTRRAEAGEITAGHRIRGLSAGDTHTAVIDPVVCDVLYGFRPHGETRRGPTRNWRRTGRHSMIADLRPRYVFQHDVSDFRVRNHHEIKDPHTLFEHHVNGAESVQDELTEVAMFLGAVGEEMLRHTEDGEVVVVDSNHDLAFKRWLKEGDYRRDPANAEFFLRSQAECYAAIKRGDKRFSAFEWAMRELIDCTGFDLKNTIFLREDDSFMVDGVENGNHGHRGANGARGTARSFVAIGPKVTIGHIHTPEIMDGVYVNGTSSLLRLSYTVGPSSWAHAHTAQLLNGKRQLITQQDDLYRMILPFDYAHLA